MLKLPRTGNVKLDKALADMEKASAEVDAHWEAERCDDSAPAPARKKRYKRVINLGDYMSVAAFVTSGGDD